MSESKNTFLLLILASTLLFPKVTFTQDVVVKLGIKDSIRSEILKETRHVLIHLPADYNTSDKVYPVLFQLDGGTEVLYESTAITNRLALREKSIPELIVVAIENSQPFRDMWPTNTRYNPEPNVAGAKDFLAFMAEELIPSIESKYHTDGNRIVFGQSLSAVFTLYAFLEKPELFHSYIASSGAFPGCEPYFKELSQAAFQQKDRFSGRKVFITNGLQDELDPEGTMNQTMMEFSTTVRNELGDQISYGYLAYPDEGHVPFQSLYHGLKFAFKSD